MEDDEEEITAAALRGKPRPLPISALSAFSYVPPRRQDPKEHSYYYRQGWVSRGGMGGKGGGVGEGAGCLRAGTEDWMLLGAAGIKDGAALRGGVGGLMGAGLQVQGGNPGWGRIGAGLHCLGGIKGRVWGGAARPGNEMGAVFH